MEKQNNKPAGQSREGGSKPRRFRPRQQKTLTLIPITYEHFRDVCPEEPFRSVGRTMSPKYFMFITPENERGLAVRVTTPVRRKPVHFNMMDASRACVIDVLYQGTVVRPWSTYLKWADNHSSFMEELAAGVGRALRIQATQRVADNEGPFKLVTINKRQHFRTAAGETKRIPFAR
jgi:hypothetical protein